MGMSAARPPVSLAALIEALEIQNEQLRAFVNPETAEVVLVSDEALAAAESADRASDVDEYRMMARFANARPTARERDVLGEALHGSGAFRRFKDACYSLGIEQDWFGFRDVEYETLAVRWCEDHGLAWTRARDSRGPDA
jgi:hypothetical protein